MKQKDNLEHESSEIQVKAELATSAKSFTVVRLNRVIRGTPLFIIHGAGGGIGVFRKLGPKLRCPAYGVQDTPQAPISGSLGDLARFYLSRIKEVQPHGRLCGYSFGCCIALYISNILCAQGEKVDNLVMVDASPAHFLLPAHQEGHH